jgi:hypothetical protein
MLVVAAEGLVDVEQENRVLWILCMTTDSEGCHMEFMYDNRQ